MADRPFFTPESVFRLRKSQMKPSKLYEALHALIGERVSLHIWVACGVGKSQIVATTRSG
jgi:hypothetical protein